MLSGPSPTETLKAPEAETKVHQTASLPASGPDLTEVAHSHLASALIVEPALPEALGLLPIMRALGIDGTVAESFQDAKEALRIPYALLMTELRLGEFNGLHLVLRAKATHPGVKAVVTSWVEDPYLREDAEALGAAFIVKPLSKRDWSAVIERTLAGAFSRTIPLRPPFERRNVERRQRSEARLAERRATDRRIGLGRTAASAAAVTPVSAASG